VRLVGEPQVPIAITASGSSYRLGEPAASFGAERAQQFLDAKMRAPGSGPAAPRDPALRTDLMKLRE